MQLKGAGRGGKGRAAGLVGQTSSVASARVVCPHTTLEPNCSIRQHVKPQFNWNHKDNCSLAHFASQAQGGTGRRVRSQGSYAGKRDR